jgi:methylphosphotriester-DNA--protein-cysteine methyltransferase
MRMKRINRVFFMDQAEAVAAGYRPCGHCMRASYLNWRADR